MSHDEEHGYSPTQGTIGAARVTVEASRPVCVARTNLFRALQDGGCSEPSGVLEAIEALIDAKRAESDWGDPSRLQVAQSMELDHIGGSVHRQHGETDSEYRARIDNSQSSVPRTAGQLTDPYAGLGPGDRSRHGVNSCEGYRGLCPSCVFRRQLQSRGNEDAQTPGIDEGSDSEAVTADPPPGYGRSRVLGIRSWPVTISPMDRRAAELGDPHAQTLVAFAGSSVTDWEALAGHAAAQRDFLLANLPRQHDVVQAAGQWAIDRWDELRATR